MMFSDYCPCQPDGVRRAVLRLLSNNDVPLEMAERALQQSLDLIRDVGRVRALASSLQLELSGFRSDNDLEMYYDVTHKGADVAYISKGWDEPGFRIGEILPIHDGDASLFWAQADETLSMLASSGIGVTTTAMSGGGYWLEMTTVIYSEGFNAATLSATLSTVAGCAARAKEVLR